MHFQGVAMDYHIDNRQIDRAVLSYSGDALGTSNLFNEKIKKREKKS